MVMTLDDDVYIVNVGDSRAVASKNDGKEIVAITSDHKPIEPREFERINRNGGKVYQSQTVFV
jgi:serine/threonine protein phosphatase PrpC